LGHVLTCTAQASCRIRTVQKSSERFLSGDR
jgi:hypothetical protein